MNAAQPHATGNALLIAAAGTARQAPDEGHSAPLDRQYILRAADRQGIAPLLAEWARKEAYPLPPEVGDRLHAAYWGNHFRNRTLLEYMRAVIVAAADAGIPLMPLKGAALASWYYPAPALRPMSDLDFLVRPADTDAIARVLLARGFAPVPKQASVLNERRDAAIFRERGFVATAGGISVMIEYRSEPLDPAIGPLLLANRETEERYRAHSARIWQRSRRASLDGIVCARIAPEDLLLHVASHLATRHAGLRLIWLRDLHEIATAHRDDLDWDYICAVAHELHLATPVAAALHASAHWLGAPIPRPQIERLWRAAARPALWQRIERRAYTAQAAALAGADLSAAESPLPWRSLAVSLGWFLTGQAPWRVIGRVVVPSRAYMAWWYTGPVASRRDYGYAVAFRIVYVGVTVLAALTARLKLRPLARWAGRWARQMQARTAYATLGE